jgi:hypothetical protein
LRQRLPFIRRGAAHQGDYFIGRHFEVTPPAEILDQFLATRPAAGALPYLHQSDNAGLNVELDIRPRHEPGAFPNVLRNRYLAFSGDSHRKRLSY